MVKKNSGKHGQPQKPKAPDDRNPARKPAHSLPRYADEPRKHSPYQLESLEPRILASVDPALGLIQQIQTVDSPSPSNAPLFADTNANSAPSSDAATTIQGEITSPGEIDRFSFTLPQKTQIYFDSLTNASTLNWSLSGPSGTVVANRAFSSSDAYDGTSILDLPAGDYLLSVDGNADATGAYAFRLLDLGNIQTITPGTPISGMLDPANQTDVYRFPAVQGDRFYFDVQQIQNGNAYMRLLNPAGGQEFFQGISDVDVITASQTGLYTLLIEGRYNATGTNTYRINVQPVTDTLTPIDLNTRVDGAISVPGQQAIHTFSLSARTQIAFDALTDIGFTWSLSGPKGSIVSGRSLQLSDSVDGNPLLDLIPGDYRLSVDAPNDATGGFAFRLLDVGSGELIATVPPSDTTLTLHTLSPGSATAIYRFDAQAGDQVFFDQQQISGGGVYWRLYSPYGDQIFFQGFTDVTAVQTMPITGRYTLLVEGRRNLTADVSHAFRMELRGNTPPVAPTGNAMDIGNVVSGSLATTSQVDNYLFTLAGDSLLSFDAQTIVSGIRWSLTGPRGAEVTTRQFTGSDSIDGNSILNLVAGTYTLKVDGTATGAYAFKLLDLSQATPITAGTTVTGILQAGGRETDTYRFTAAAGDPLYFDWRQSTNVNGTWRLIDPYGNQIFNQWQLADHGVDILPVTGTYYLLVEGRRDSAADNSYQFQINSVPDQPIAIAPGQSLNLGPYWADGVYGKGLEFAENDYLEVPHGPATNLLNNLTVELNFRVDQFLDTWTPLVVKSANLPSNWQARTYGMWLNSNGQITFGSGTSGPGSATGLIQTGKWYHASGVIDRTNGQVRLYIDGTLVGSSSIANTPGTAYDQPLMLGKSLEGYNEYNGLFGAIDEVRLWSRARSQAEIQASQTRELNDAEKSDPTLTVYLPLNEGSGRTSSDPRNDGTTINNIGTFRNVADQLGDSIQGRIRQAGQRDIYTFALTQDSQLYFDSLSDSGLTWTLTGPRGTVMSGRALLSSNANEYGGSNPVLNLVAGSYTLVIDGSADAIGPYAFRLLDLTQTGTAITPGTPVTAQLFPGNATNVYHFPANQGDQFFFDMRSVTDADAYWRLIDPYGQQIFYAGLGTDIDVTTLVSTGTYTLLIEGRRYNVEPNAYRFNVQPVHNGTTAIVPGVANTAPQWIGGQMSGGVQLNGYDWLEVPNGPATDLTGSLTVEAWFKADRFANTWTPLVCKSAVDSIRGYSLWLNSAGYVYLSANSAPVGISSANSSIAPGQWYHVAGVLDRSSSSGAALMKLYVNGVMVASTTLTGSAVFNTAPLLIGRTQESWTTWAPFEGIVDDVRLWNVARTDAEILAAKDTPLTGNEAGLTLYLPLDQTTGTSIDSPAATPLPQSLYDATADFSLSQNPNGPWTAGWTSTLGSAFNPFTTGAAASNGFQVWNSPAIDTTGLSFAKNLGAVQYGIPTGSLTLHPGPQNQYAVLRFTAPSTGTYDLSAQFFTGDSGDTDANILLNGNASSPLMYAVTTGGNPVFAKQITLNAGDTLDFVVGSKGSYFSDNTPINIRLTQVTPAAGPAATATWHSVDETAPGVVTGRIEYAGVTDYYTFTLTETTRLYFDTLTDRNDIYWSLTGPRGAVVSSRALYNSNAQDIGSGNPLLSLVPGNYTLSIDGSGDVTGHYAFRLLKLTDGQAITPGLSRQLPVHDPQGHRQRCRHRARPGLWHGPCVGCWPTGWCR